MITPVLVTTLEDAQTVRMIRNQLKGYMTNDSTHITPEQQTLWFDKYRRSGNKLYLYYEDSTDSVVGFGYVRVQEDKKLWGTLAVLPEFQSKGYGTEIYRHMTRYAGTLWIEIYANNNASLIAALKSGFEIQYINDKVIVLKAQVSKD